MSLSKMFDDIYTNQTWSLAGLGSGTGSSLILTEKTRSLLSNFIKDHSIKSMIDVSCGKMNWMPLVLKTTDPGFQYLGLDIVEDVVKQMKFTHQNSLFSKYRVDFEQADITKDPISPGYDLIHCRDTLQHLSFGQVVSALENFSKSEFKWIILGSYHNVHKNVNTDPGGYFSINLLDPPFSMPRPYQILSEETNKLSDEPEKFYLIYDQASYKAIDFNQMKKRCKC
jgi:SAM-dependent methyltransferase